jgi:hypothetical protein
LPISIEKIFEESILAKLAIVCNLLVFHKQMKQGLAVAVVRGFVFFSKDFRYILYYLSRMETLAVPSPLRPALFFL